MIKRPGKDEWFYFTSSEDREAIEEILSMAVQIRYIITRLPLDSMREELLEFYGTLQAKIKEVGDSYIEKSRRYLHYGFISGLRAADRIDLLERYPDVAESAAIFEAEARTRETEHEHKPSADLPNP
jgi:hypothetical protein